MREEEQEAEDRGKHEWSPSTSIIRVPNTTSFPFFPQITVVTLPAAFLEIITMIVEFIAKLYQSFTQWLNTTSLQIDLDYQLNSGNRRLSGQLQFVITAPNPDSNLSGNTPVICPLMEQALATLNHQQREESTMMIPICLHQSTPHLHTRVPGCLETINKDITPLEWACIEDHRLTHISPKNSKHDYPQVEPNTTPPWYQYTDSNIGSRH